MDGLPHVGGDVSAITAPRPICRAAVPGMTGQAPVRIVDAKIHTRPLCRARLFGVDGRNLAVVFRLDSFLSVSRNSSDGAVAFFTWTETAPRFDSPPHASPGRRQRRWTSGRG